MLQFLLMPFALDGPGIASGPCDPASAKAAIQTLSPYAIFKQTVTAMLHYARERLQNMPTRFEKRDSLSTASPRIPTGVRCRYL